MLGRRARRGDYDPAVEAAPDRIAEHLAELGLPVERRGERRWVLQVPCATRGVLATVVDCGERTLSLRAFFMRAPDREREAVYRRLLGKHLETRAWRFALDAAGDVYLAADVPLAGLGADDLDGLLGALSTHVDETWEGTVRTGFDVPADTALRASGGGGAQAMREPKHRASL
jgi:hypothetical protein